MRKGGERVKRFIEKMMVVVGGLLAVFGITSGNAKAFIPASKDKMVNISKQTPLYLKHAKDFQLEMKNMLTWHYSHASHQSHYSHRSHYSHYSGY